MRAIFRGDTHLKHLFMSLHTLLYRYTYYVLTSLHTLAHIHTCTHIGYRLSQASSHILLFLPLPFLLLLLPTFFAAAKAGKMFRVTNSPLPSHISPSPPLPPSDRQRAGEGQCVGCRWEREWVHVSMKK